MKLPGCLVTLQPIQIHADLVYLENVLNSQGFTSERLSKVYQSRAAYNLLSYVKTNERLNKHFFSINRHPKLQWLCATTVSPDMGAQRHQWIAPKKKEPGAGSLKKQLAELFPEYKDDEIDLLAAITTKKELDAYIKQHGREK